MNKALVKSIQSTIDGALSQARQIVVDEVDKANKEAIERAEDELQLVSEMMEAVNESKVEMETQLKLHINAVFDELGKRHDKLIAAFTAHAGKIKTRLGDLGAPVE